MEHKSKVLIYHYQYLLLFADPYRALLSDASDKICYAVAYGIGVVPVSPTAINCKLPAGQFDDRLQTDREQSDHSSVILSNQSKLKKLLHHVILPHLIWYIMVYKKMYNYYN
jgi:hypothetical protein